MKITKDTKLEEYSIGAFSVVLSTGMELRIQNRATLF